MKKIKYIFPLFFFIIISCNNVKESKKMPLFKFDEVEHYSTGKKDTIFSNINRKKYKNLTNDEKLYLDFVAGNIPTKLTDKSFVTNLKKLKFKKRIIDKSKLDDLKEIFSEEFCDELQFTACSPMYRDIYIFKKNNQIIGIAKICFGCGIVDFTSNDYNWIRFGECDSYNRLKKI
ncbi:hypothetical protein EQG63_09345 [Flavobacterium amnicola]|uniref:Lipoprotein n=1 Tax=Flavobacterium amnicola TaxID=2506422 RepID=A0A4V1N1R6_9FLAO|nr:hypothetical protein [Flavobacterium amnicola]RXR17685.1 hypothetical protein EQG63_09345 [Flavobacterium amnicola]